MTLRQRPASDRQLGVTEALRAVRLGRCLEGSDERDLAAEGHFDAVGPGQLEDGERVRRDLARVDVAGRAGDRDDLGVVGGSGIEEGEGVVDPGVDVQDDRMAIGH